MSRSTVEKNHLSGVFFDPNCGVISANKGVVRIFDNELVDEVGDADQDQNAVNEVRRDWHASERLFLMHHVDDARQEEHVDHRAEATTVSDDISDLQKYHHQPEVKKNITLS